MLRVSVRLIFALVWGAAVGAQQPESAAGDVARALLLGPEFEQAAGHLEAFADRPEERALLEAAALPAPQRVRSMLELARACIDRPIADRALVAGAGCLLLAQGRASLVPRLHEREPDVLEDFGEQSSDGELARLLVAYLDVLARRRTMVVVDPEAQREAGRLLRQASVAAAMAEPVLVRPGTGLPVPAPLAERLRLRVVPAMLERPVLDAAGDAVGAARVEHVLHAGRYGQQLPPLPVGTHVLELSRDGSPWRVLRPVVVSDLDARALRFAHETCLLVEQDGRPVADASVRLIGDDGVGSLVDEATTDDDGFARLLHDPRTSGRVFVTAGQHRTVLTLPRLYRQGSTQSQVRHHLAVDRPVYRPGQQVQGRVRLQRYHREPVLAGRERVPSLRSVPARADDVRLVWWPGTPHEVTRTGSTDAHGDYAFTFEVPAFAPVGEPEVHLFVGAGERQRLVSPLSIAAFRRAAVLLSVDAPDELPSGRATTEVVVAARYASGAPAVGLTGSLRVKASRIVRLVELVLDEQGQARVPIEVSRERFHRVELDASVTSPDGVVVRARHRMFRPAVSDDDARRAQATLAIDSPRRLVRGREVEIPVRGRANTTALFAAARDVPLFVTRLQFDEHGRSLAHFTLPESLGPSIDLLVVGADGRDSMRVEVVAADALAALAVSPMANRYGPGDEVVLRVRARDEDGRGVAGSVAVSVVDERVFALRSERSLDGAPGLRPSLPWLHWRHLVSLRPAEPLDVIGRMLWNGRLVSGAIGGTSRTGLYGAPGGPAAGGAAGPSVPTDVQLRRRFRETAHFEPKLRTDAEGRAELRFRLPDDLTTFRIRALAIDREGHAVTATARIEVASDVAVTPLVPRLLRVGDRVQLPTVIDARDANGSAARFACEADGHVGTTLQDATPELTGGIGEAVVDVVAKQAGDATMSFVARLGEGEQATGDAVELSVPVLADVVRRYVVGSRRLGPGRHVLPVPAREGEAVTLQLLDGRSAVLRAAARFLSEYPHGCVEQTLSRLLPYLVDGADRVGERRQRLLAGLRRLNELRDRRRGGFAWWPGRRADVGMTALVLHGLVHARSAGVDLAAHDLIPELSRASYAKALAALASRQGRVDDKREDEVEQAELLAAVVRWQPTAARLASLQRLVDADQPLPAGLLLRSGLALAAAGDRDRALATVARVDAGAAVTAARSPWQRFPGEGDVAVRATRLELLARIAGDEERTAMAATEVLSAFGGDGFGSTYDSSCAFVALAAEAGGVADAVDERVVRVTGADGTRDVAIGGERKTQRIRLPFAQVSIEVPAGEPVLATWRAEVHEPGSAHAGWQQGLVVTRRLANVDGTARDPGPLERLRAVAVHVTVTSSTAARYVAVECPLPAGFELASMDARLERHDDRVVATIPRLYPGRPVRLSFTVVPALTGALRWPPAVAAAMYAPQFQGGTAGGVLVVAPARERVRAPIEVQTFSSPPRRQQPARSATERALAGFKDLVREVDHREPVRSARSAEVPPETEEIAAAVRDSIATANLRADAWLAIADVLSFEWQGAAVGAAPSPHWLRVRELQRELHGEAVLRLLQQCRVELLPAGGDHRADYDAVDTCVAALESVALQHTELAAELARDLCRVLSMADDRERADADLARWAGSCDDAVAAHLQDEWVKLVAHPSEEVREAAIDHLSDERFAALPASLVVRAVAGQWWGGALARLCGSATGRRWVERQLQDREWCSDYCDELCEQLPTDMWKHATAALVAALAEGDQVEVVRQHAPSESIRGAVRASGSLGYRCELVDCLIARGEFGSVGAEGASGDLLDACLLAAGGHPQSIAKLRAWLASDADARPWQPLQLVLRSLGPSLSVPELLRHCDDLDVDQQQAVLASWPLVRIVRLLRAVGEEGFSFDALPTRSLPDLERELDACAIRLPERRDEIEDLLARVPARAASRDLLRVGAPR